MSPRLPITLLLAFFLLFAQQGAVLHGVAHLSEYHPARQQQKQLPQHPGEVCDDCLAYAGIGGAIFSAALPTLFFTSSCLPADACPAAFSTAPLLAYRSRAPPYLV